MKTLIKILCLSMFWFSCDEKNQNGICVFYETQLIGGSIAHIYDCWDNKTEDGCYGEYWYANQTCEEFCEDKIFCSIEN